MAVKKRSLPERKMARMLQKSEGIKYTEALTRVRTFLAAKKVNDGEAEDIS